MPAGGSEVAVSCLNRQHLSGQGTCSCPVLGWETSRGPSLLPDPLGRPVPRLRASGSGCLYSPQVESAHQCPVSRRSKGSFTAAFGIFLFPILAEKEDNPATTPKWGALPRPGPSSARSPRTGQRAACLLPRDLACGPPACLPSGRGVPARATTSQLPASLPPSGG